MQEVIKYADVIVMQSTGNFEVQVDLVHTEAVDGLAHVQSLIVTLDVLDNQRIIGVANLVTPPEIRHPFAVLCTQIIIDSFFFKCRIKCIILTRYHSIRAVGSAWIGHTKATVPRNCTRKRVSIEELIVGGPTNQLIN